MKTPEAGQRVMGVSVPLWATPWNHWLLRQRRLGMGSLALVVPCAALLSATVVACASSVGAASGGPRKTPRDSSRRLPSRAATVGLSGSGSLSEQEFRVAVAIARREADTTARSITSATATRGEGTATDSNAGLRCTSGTVLHIKLIGTFNIVHGGIPQPNGSTGGTNGDVHAVLITADPGTAQACFISVQTGSVRPEPGATVLFTGWP